MQGSYTCCTLSDDSLPSSPHLTAVARAVALSWLFAPVLYSAPLVFSFDYGRDAWCRLLVWTLEVAGPAFIKWGQWAATRPDLLPRDVCDALGRLHANAKAHSFKEVREMGEGVVREAPLF